MTYFASEGISKQVLYCRTPRNFTEVEGLCILGEFISQLLTHKCFTSKSTVIVISHSLGPINIMDECDTLWKRKVIKVSANK